MKSRWLILLGVAVFLATLIVHAPVAVLYGYLRPANFEVEVIGLDGTLGAGSAAAIVVDGRPLVRNLRWDLQGLSLLLGRLAFAVSADGDGLVAEGRVALPLWGGVELSDLRASGALRPLLATLSVVAPIEGQFGLDAQKVTVRGGLPVVAEGTLTIQRLSWNLGRNPLPIGDFQAQATTADDGIGVRIGTLGGPLDLGGDAHLRHDRGYDAHLQIKAKADAPAPLVNLLATLGAPDTQGYYHVRRQGQLDAAVPPAAGATD